MKTTIAFLVATAILLACYREGDPLPPCSAAPSACGGYPEDKVVITESKDAGLPVLKTRD